jgi:hypothetical protein
MARAIRAAAVLCGKFRVMAYSILGRQAKNPPGAKDLGGWGEIPPPGVLIV